LIGGDPSITKPIIINGSIMEVTTNLEAALRELRAWQITKIWVDAICINQRDVAERGIQVPRMGLIYSKATEVIAWLGVEAENSRAACKAIRSLEDLQPDVRQKALTKASSSIQALFHRSFWKRVWIIQEISKGPNVYILCGKDSISWERMRSTFGYLDEISLLPPEVQALEEFRKRESRSQRPDLRQAIIDSRHFLSTDARDKLYALLGLTSNGGDIILTPNYVQSPYSVYFQAFKEVARKDPHMWYLFREMPDEEDSSKRKATWTSFEESIWRWIIESWAKRIEIDEIENNWQKYSRKHVFYRDPRHYTSLPMMRVRPFPHSFEELTREEREELPSISSYGMRATCAVIDSIETLSSSLSRTSWQYETQQPFVPGGPRKSHRSPRDQPKASYVLKNIWRALIALSFEVQSDSFGHPNQPISVGVSPIYLCRSDAAYILTRLCKRSQWVKVRQPVDPAEFFSNWLCENRNLVYYGKTLRHWVKIYSRTERYKKQSQGDYSFVRQFFSNCDVTLPNMSKGALENYEAKLLYAIKLAAEAKMRLAVTEKRQMMGLVPAGTKKGDIVALVQDCNLPIILRRDNHGGYIFLGETAFYSDTSSRNSFKGSTLGYLCENDKGWNEWVKSSAASFQESSLDYRDFNIY
jgi:hypothetical protein